MGRNKYVGRGRNGLKPWSPGFQFGYISFWLCAFSQVIQALRLGPLGSSMRELYGPVKKPWGWNEGIWAKVLYKLWNSLWMQCVSVCFMSCARMFYTRVCAGWYRLLMETVTSLRAGAVLLSSFHPSSKHTGGLHVCRVPDKASCH